MHCRRASRSLRGKHLAVKDTSSSGSSVSDIIAVLLCVFVLRRWRGLKEAIDVLGFNRNFTSGAQDELGLLQPLPTEPRGLVVKTI